MKKIILAEDIAMCVAGKKREPLRYREKYENFYNAVRLFLETRDEELVKHVLDEEFENVFFTFKGIISKTKYFNFINPTPKKFTKRFLINNQYFEIVLFTDFYVKNRKKVFYYFILPDAMGWTEAALKHFHRIGNDIINNTLPPEKSEFRIINLFKKEIIKGNNVSYRYHQKVSNIVSKIVNVS
ncbi:hypothetical protein SU69_02195 [Thermosipho melanesiensis]|uniref:Uncharacterized protein n=2 Tax=Thermosipho melanesiensis TaxID=46541 RepID=A6LK38_THEM4|nr:hypothetical protein [Thermosipho melanesiensis]ABR30289.1 hypothetical protein Tmel_0421 [Thermosipho melanesiensis BI429]APT73466.1 hypothetical protein BW47_02290 [Thermosipho melanesiensis]OOC37412.1 hypothetical protein SU68_02205 [Thermosipho melanesiensis]OOC39774.1 hypothetical protein SU69_02195 [Thermosipho melanesiensis]OOC39879.1 hypothetical protein SU70_02190 [Thermosipho melanesiensis]